jgi:hypothetical protein
VLTAIANSKLRIQIVQWHWVRFYSDIKPKIAGTMVVQEPRAPAAAPSPTSPFGQGGIFGGGTLGGGRVPRAAPQPGRQMPPPGARAGGPPGRTTRPAMEEQEWQLVELSVYGIASLYERYPPRSPPELEAYKAAATGTKPSAGTKPGAPPSSPKPGATPTPPKPGPPTKKS